MAKEKKTKEQKAESVSVSMDKVIPKFCTTISVSLLRNKNFVLSMIYKEGEQSTLIERIVIDSEHAKSLNEVLEKMIKENVNGAKTVK